jgi:hypothetical protein
LISEPFLAFCLALTRMAELPLVDCPTYNVHQWRGSDLEEGLKFMTLMVRKHSSSFRSPTHIEQRRLVYIDRKPRLDDVIA